MDRLRFKCQVKTKPMSLRAYLPGEVKMVSKRAGRYRPKWYEEMFISVNIVQYHHKCQIIISFKCKR